MIFTIHIEEAEGTTEVDIEVNDEPHKSPIECVEARRNGRFVDPPSQERILEAIVAKAGYI